MREASEPAGKRVRRRHTPQRKSSRASPGRGQQSPGPSPSAHPPSGHHTSLGVTSGLPSGSDRPSAQPSQWWTGFLWLDPALRQCPGLLGRLPQPSGTQLSLQHPGWSPAPRNSLPWSRSRASVFTHGSLSPFSEASLLPSPGPGWVLDPSLTCLWSGDSSVGPRADPRLSALALAHGSH